MENRFGIKDFFLIALLILVIVVVLLAMKQFDRQYEAVRDIQRQGNDQLRELVGIRAAIERGGLTSIATSPQPIVGADGFAALRELTKAGKYDQGDWFVQNFPVQVAKLTPLLSTDQYAAIIQARVQDSLAYRDPKTLEYAPQLATSWTIDDRAAEWQKYVDQRMTVPITADEIMKESEYPPPDKVKERAAYVAARLKEGRRSSDIGAEAKCPFATVIKFKLRHGVTFSDGSPFGADDIVFSYDWAMNPQVDAPRDRQALQRLKSVVKVADDEVDFNFREPFFQSFDLASSINILSKAFYGKLTPAQFNDSVGLLIGTGPYRLATPDGWKPTPDKIELIRNDRYWGLPSSFDRIVFSQVQEESTELVMFTNGELDALNAQPEQYHLLLSKPDTLTHANNFEYLSPIAGYHFIAWNEHRDGNPTLFTDKRVRQAMTMLTDRNGICDNILLKYAVPATGPFSPLSKQNDPALVDWKYDQAAALELLKDAGFEVRDSSGILSRADGTKLQFKLSYPNKSQTLQRMMQFIHDTFARAGVAMQMDPLDWTVIEQKLKNRQFDAISLAWSAGIEDDIYQMFDSSQQADQGDDFMSYGNPALDKAIRSARSSVDEQKRMPLWHECQRILHEDQPYTFLTISKSLKFIDKRIQNVAVSTAGLNFVQDWTQPLPWYVPAAMQKYTK